MDTSVDTDPALAELKSLRDGAGLSADRLAGCPNLLSALGTSDPGEAFDSLRAILRKMGEGQHARALRVDFGLGLALLLGRDPVSREIDFLGPRRSAYAEVIGFSEKTLARWSEATINELRGLLITDQFNGHILVSAAVRDRRVDLVDVKQFERGDEKFSSGRNTSFPNPQASSLPLVLYAFPRDWKPASIHFAVGFMGSDYPEVVWAFAADDVFGVSFGHKRYPLQVIDGVATCRVDDPRRDQLYGVGWNWSS